MKRSELLFARPKELAATSPTEARGIERDTARLMVTTPDGHQHAHFRDLPDFLTSGDLIVANESATVAASLPAHGSPGDFVLSLSTDYGNGLWLAEPRWSTSRPGPLPLRAGETFTVDDAQIRLIAPYPGLPRLWFVHTDSDLREVMRRVGKPIRYGYVTQDYPLDLYQTVFSRVPGSAEMPSAAYPFTPRVVDVLKAKGVEIAPIVLHTGVSSLEVETDVVEEHPLYPEPFDVPDTTAAAVNRARSEGRRVIAVGTTVVRALESAWNGEAVEGRRGFTRVYVHPRRGIKVVDGLITGLHDPETSHLAMLYSVASQSVIRSAYAEAVAEGYLWHEFGDSHLILTAANAAEHPVRGALAVA